MSLSAKALEQMATEAVDLKALGLPGADFESILTDLRKLYGLS